MYRACRPNMMLRVSRTLREKEDWRDHGLSYVKYLNVCTDALHKCVKENKQNKYAKQSTVGYIAQQMDGSGGFAKVTKVEASLEEYGTIVKKAE